MGDSCAGVSVGCPKQYLECDAHQYCSQGPANEAEVVKTCAEHEDTEHQEYPKSEEAE